MKSNAVKLLLGVVIIVFWIFIYEQYIHVSQDDFQTYKKNMLHYFPVLTESMDENMLKMSREHNWYSYTWNDVYYQGQLLPEAHARTFIALEGYGIDTQAKMLYKWEISLSWLDISTLRFNDELPLYIQDKNWYYFVAQQPWYIMLWSTKVEIKSLQKLWDVIGKLRSIQKLAPYFARDDKSLYYMWHKLANVNPDTIIPVVSSWSEDSDYFMQDENIFMGLYEISGVDIDSFVIDPDNQTLAHDKYHTYKNGEIVK